ncbi:MAG: conjugal transfer protein TraG N-terminal domain-containing protein [Nitrococcus mobilis]|nr:conjugal transfer protein TraG N-terminal domain-containing protein [Nitrococcus mobilis]
MTYTIYSSGDGAFLAEILNALATIMGSGNLAVLAAIGLLLGVVLAVIHSILEGGRKLSLGGSMVALVFYMVLFTPRVDVVVYDTYSWTGRPVDNVPLGVAAAGMTLSHIGYFVTKQFETAYSLPGMLDTGYGTPLEMLLSVRGAGLGTANSIAPNDNLLQTLANYINECTETGILLDMKDPANMVSAPNVWSAVEFPSVTYTTKTFLPGDPPDGSTRTCSSAYTAIADQWGARLDAWNKYLSHRYDVANARSLIQGALDSMVGMGLSANQYMKNALVSNVIRRVASGNYSTGTYRSTVITTQAAEQARVQYAAEASMFARFARPLMTFVEGFVYSIVPFMVFIIGFGLAGMKLIGRYVLILLWVQLWIPIMSVTNMFTELAFSRQMDSVNALIQSSGDPLNPLSILGMQVMQGEAADWIAVGGNLIAAAPALALTVLYGGAYAMVNLAGRLNPQDMVDETQAAPSLYRNPGVLSMGSQYQHNMTTGLTRTGATEVLGATTLGTMANSMVTSSRQELTAAQQSYADTVSSGIASSLGSTVTASELQSLGRNVQVSHGTAFGRTIERAESLSDAYNFSQESTEQLRGALTAAAAGGLKAPAWQMARADLGAKVETGVTEAGEQAHGLNQKLDELYKEASSERVQKSFEQAITVATADSTQQSFEQMARGQDQQAYSASLQSLRQAQRSFTEAEQLNDSVGMNQSIGLAAMATRLASKPDIMGHLHQYLEAHPALDEAVENQMGQLAATRELGGFAANRERYTAAAAMQVLAANLDDPSAQAKMLDMLYATGYVTDGTAPEPVDADASRGIAGGVDARAESMLPRAREVAAEARANARAADARAEQAATEADKEISSPGAYALRHKEEALVRMRDDTATTGAVGDKALPEMLRHLEQAEGLPMAANVYGLMTGLGALGVDRWQSVTSSAGEQSQAAKSALEDLNKRIGTGEVSQQSVVERTLENASDIKVSRYEKGLEAGLSEIGAGLYADASISSAMGSIQKVTGGVVANIADTVAESFGYDLDSGYRDALHEKWYDSLIQQELARAGGNEELAHRIADAKFNRIVEAGIAGDRGTDWLAPVVAVNLAQESGDAEDPHVEIGRPTVVKSDP